MSERALSVRQPWAHLIIAGIKDVENRSWRTAYRGRLWIHAGGTLDCDWDEVFAAGDGRAARRAQPLDAEGHCLPPVRELAFSAVLGSVRLLDCVPIAEVRDRHWAGGPWCWLLDDAQPLTLPYPCRGNLGLWTPPAGFRRRRGYARISA